MSDKAALLREADETFADLRRAIDGLSEDEMREVWLGTWGVREILIHIGGWHHAMIPALGHIARGEAPYPAGTYDDFDAWNARFVAEKTGVKAVDAAADVEASHRAFLAASREVPDQYFESGGAARGLLDAVPPAHYREHPAQIREWRQGAA